jgi:hypothetical protein
MEISMKGIFLAATAMAFLLTAAAQAMPGAVVTKPIFRADLPAPVQFKNQGQGEGSRKRGAFKPKSSAECFSRCTAAGKKEGVCTKRCQNPSAKSLTHKDR